MRGIIFLMAGLSFLRDCAETIILPILPAIALSIHASRGEAQLIVPIFSSGILLTKLVLINGTAERLGYQKMLLNMMPLTIVGSLLCLIHDIQFMYIGRFLQGCGLGCITTIVVCELKLQAKADFMKIWSSLSKYLRFSALIGSFLGAILLKLYDWQTVFIFLAILASIVYFFLACGSFSHTKVENTPPLKLILKTLFARKSYVAQINYYALIYSGQAVFYTISPFLFINDLGLLPHEYAFIVAAFAISQFLSKWVLQQFITHDSSNFITFISLSACLGSSMIFLLGYYLHVTHPILPLIGFMLYAAGFSALGPIVKDNISERFNLIQTSAIGIHGIAYSAIASILTFIMARVVDVNLLKVGIVYLVICVLAFILYFIFIYTEKTDNAHVLRTGV